MEIKTNYNIGSDAWTIDMRKDTYWDPCFLCEGKGEVAFKVDKEDKMYRCPECTGKQGVTRYTDYIYYPKRLGKITAITIAIAEPLGTDYISYSTNNYPRPLLEGLVYVDEVECQAECDRRNKKAADDNAAPV